MFKDTKLNEALKKAEAEFYGNADLNYFQKTGRLEKMASRVKSARKIPRSNFNPLGFTGLKSKGYR